MEYGDRFYCVRTKGGLDLFIWADRLDIVDGALVVYGHSKDRTIKQVLYSFAPTVWLHVYAASAVDGKPIAIGEPMVG